MAAKNLVFAQTSGGKWFKVPIRFVSDEKLRKQMRVVASIRQKIYNNVQP